MQKVRTAKKLTPQQLALLQRLLRTHPELTNAQIAELVGTSDSTVGAERRGVRAPKQAAKQAAFEKVAREMGKVIPTPRPEPLRVVSDAAIPSDAALVVSNPDISAFSSTSTNDVEEKARRLAAEIRLQALTALRVALTNAKISPEDALAALEAK